MRCAICKKTSDQVQLFEGLLYDEMIRICEPCADTEGIPRIKKPSTTQLERADKSYTVRERMEHMSGMRKRTDLSEDQNEVQGNLARLKIPAKKEVHENVHDNYYWAVNIGRRRKKMSLGQLAAEIGIDQKVIKGIESGKIPKDFETIFLRLEKFLGVKLIKNHRQTVSFKRDNRDEEKEILDIVKGKMDKTKNIDFDDMKEEKEQLEKLSRGEIDFSREDNIKDITLNDLIDAKREKEKKEVAKKRIIQTDSLLGDEIELEDGEL
jgi:ribosome-binding protein aMBF1 (putative translation factor)